MTWADLVAAVRAQIDVSDDLAYQWCLERARVLNAESGWLTTEEVSTSTGGEEVTLAADLVSTEAVSVDGVPYRRSTPSQLDIARACAATRRIYAEAFAPRALAIWPPVTAGAEVRVRYLADVADDRTLPPPFPSDLQSVIADGAIAVGLARMDERFDSAGYFDAKFADGIQRLKRRRHSHIGRGGTRIRVAP
jgi:hypothetical protein